MISSTQLFSNIINSVIFTFLILIVFFVHSSNASICKKVAENIYNLKPSNFHRLCLMNEFSETPAHYVYECKKKPSNLMML